MANRDYDDIGKNIEELIERAITTSDYRELSQSISSVINTAVNAGSEGFRNVMQDVNIMKKQYQNAASRTSERQYAPQTIKAKVPVLYKSMTGNKVLGVMEMAGGGVLTLAMGGGLIANSVINTIANNGGMSFSSILLAVGTCVGIGAIGAGLGLIKKVERFQQYKKGLEGQNYCDVEKLAKKIGRKGKFVRKDLKKMIAKGWFIEGHLDDSESCMISSDEMYAQYQASQKALEEKKAKEKATIDVDGSYSKEVQDILDRGNEFLLKIRRSNEAIPGEVMTDKISRMEMLIQKIFERVKEHPEIIPDMKKLMNYYLPMTVKLLDAYEDMDRQTIQGENIQNSKTEIENTLDTLNTAYEKLLDSVYKDTALDISSDITVLNTLLAQEGLTEDEIHEKMKAQAPQLQMPSN